MSRVGIAFLPSSAWARTLELRAAAALSPDDTLAALDSSRAGLAPAEAERRLQAVGPNALRSHGARPLAVLARQLRNPLLILLRRSGAHLAASSASGPTR